MQFRPSTPADLKQIQLLAASAFESTAPLPFVDAPIMAWKFWTPRADYTEPRGFVLIHDERVVAHAGIWPVMIGGQVGAHLIDWMAASDLPGVGVSLHQHLGERLEFQFSVGGADAGVEMLPALGFHPAGEAQQWARPLRPLRQAVHHQWRDVKLPARFVRNSWRSLFPRTRARPDLRIERTRACKTVERPETFFEYIGGIPGCPTLCYSLTDDAGPVGSFALTVVELQARVTGIWLERPSLQAWTDALVAAQSVAARDTDACEIIFRAESPISRNAAHDTGMTWVASDPIYRRARDGADLDLPLDYQLGDNDAFFLRVRHGTAFSM